MSSKAEVGDLVVWSAQSRWSPMQFGIVYRTIDDTPWVIRMGDNRKQMTGLNYLIVAGTRDGVGFEDVAIRNAIAWYLEKKD